jgi:ribosomal protein S8
MYVEKTQTNDVPFKIYKENVVRELQEWGWIKSVDVIDHNPIRVAYTWLYPDSNREKLLTEVNKFGIISIGRYGKHKFQGIAESIQDGLNI